MSSSAAATTTTTTNSARGPVTPGPVTIAPSREMRIAGLATFTTTVAPANIPKGDECSICLESLAPASDSPQEQAQVAQDDAVVRPACGHAMHHGCLLRWTEQRATCPYCRQAVFCGYGKVGDRDTIRKFAVPFESGDFVISEKLWTEWANSCDSDEEFSWVMEFREFIDEEACWRFFRGEW